MKLAENANDLLLGWSIFPQAKSYFPPDLVDGALTVHQPDEWIGRRGKTQDPARRVVLENVPKLIAIVMAMNFYMAPEAWLQRSHTIPGWTVKGSGHFSTATMPRA